MPPANILGLAPVLVSCCALQTLDTGLVHEILSEMYHLSLLFNAVPQQFSATDNFSKLLNNPGQ